MPVTYYESLDTAQIKELHSFAKSHVLPPLMLPEWLGVATDALMRNVAAFLSTDHQNAINGFCLGYFKHHIFYTLPFGFYASDEQIADLLKSKLQTYAVQKGWSSAYLLSNRHFEGLGECNIRSHMILPLGASSEDALYQSIPKKQRNMIKKAQTQNYDISTSWIHFDAFYDIYKQHCRAKSLSTKPRLYFETLKRVFGDCITLYSALSNKEPVAGMIFLCSSHASSYLFNASSTDAQKNGVNNLLMWEAARHFHYQHQNYIELGFSTPQSPVYQFKKRLSKDICEQQLYGYELIFGNLAMPNRLKNMARNKYNGILQRLSLRSFMVEDPETKLF